MHPRQKVRARPSRSGPEAVGANDQIEKCAAARGNSWRTSSAPQNPQDTTPGQRRHGHAATARRAATLAPSQGVACFAAVWHKRCTDLQSRSQSPPHHLTPLGAPNICVKMDTPHVCPPTARSKQLEGCAGSQNDEDRNQSVQRP